MYHLGSDSDPQEAHQPGFHYLDKDNHYAEYWLHSQPPHQHGHQPYPSSAPAVATTSDDYFSFSANPSPPEHTNEPSIDHFPSLFKRNDGDSYVDTGNLQLKQQNPSAGVYPNKIRHRSNLSHSYTNSNRYNHPESTSEPETSFQPVQQFQQLPQSHLQQHSQHLQHLQHQQQQSQQSQQSQQQQQPQHSHQHQSHQHQSAHLSHQQHQHQHPQPSKTMMRPSSISRTKKRNPGFRIQLDNLESGSPLQRFQSQISASPHSDSSFEVNYNHMQILGPDVYLQQGTGDMDKGQENITPLMNPPQTTEHGYFGAYDTRDAPVGDGSMLGGYLTVPPEADEQDHRNRNSEIDNYLNYPVDDISGYYDFDERNGLDNEAFNGFYNHENARADASFMPLLFENGARPDPESQAELRPPHSNVPTGDGTFPKGIHDGPPNGYIPQHARVNGNQQNEHLDRTQKRPVVPHQEVLDRRQEHIQAPRQTLHQNMRQEPLREPSQEQRQESRSKPVIRQPLEESHALEAEGNYKESRLGEHHIPVQENIQDELRTQGSPRANNALSPSRPELERSVSEPIATERSVDKKLIKLMKKKKSPKGTVCSICDKFISRDFSRHIRIHNEVGRFQCVFPRNYCKHRTGKFNRPYDYKKHLLNMHFNFDEPSAKTAPNLSDKLNIPGSCVACGQKFVGNDWLDHHILTKDLSKKCPELQRLERIYGEESKTENTVEESVEDKFLEDRNSDIIDEDFDDSN